MWKANGVAVGKAPGCGGGGASFSAVDVVLVGGGKVAGVYCEAAWVGAGADAPALAEG